MAGTPMLMCWVGYDDATRMHDQKPIREMDADELMVKSEATGFLRQLGRDSPYAELQAAHEDMVAAVEALESSLSGAARVPERELSAVHRAFKNWLSAVRTFDDSTSRMLARRYGNESGELKRFRRLTSQEYDNVFAYRLAFQLRNASQHAERVINAVGLESREADGGQIETRITLGFDGPNLVERFPKIKATVRDELRALTGTIPTQAVVSQVMDCCTRAYASLLVSLSDDIDRQASVLEALHQEALDQGGQAASVWTVTSGQPGEAMTVQFHWVEVQLAWAVRNMLEQSVRIAAPQARP